MAKLSGVKTLDMVGGEVTKVEYNGEIYEKVGTDSPIVGDIGMIIKAWGSLVNGDFYEVEKINENDRGTYPYLSRHISGKVQDEDTMFFRKQVSLKVGDKVRLTIPEGKRPINGWGDAHNGDVGVIESVQGEILSINFPDHEYWYGYISEVTKVEESPKTSGAKAGDIIEMTSDCIWDGYDKGDVFTVRVDRRGPYIYDNDGDRRRIDKIPHIEYKIVKEAEEAPKLDPKPLFAKVNRPNNEPIAGDYVEFEEDRPYITSGKKYEIIDIDDWGDPRFIDDDGDEEDADDIKTIYVKYTQEQAAKEPKVGDKVLVVNPSTTLDRYEKGDILTVSELDSVPHAPRPNIRVEEIDLYLFKEEVIVLTPEQAGTTTQQSDETEAEVDTDVKAEFERKQEQAKVNPEGIEEGDLVLIESLDGSAACGFYEGSIYIVGNYEKRMGRARKGRLAIKDGKGNFGYIDEANVKLVAKAADLHV